MKRTGEERTHAYTLSLDDVGELVEEALRARGVLPQGHKSLTATPTFADPTRCKFAVRITHHLTGTYGDA